MVWRQDFEDVMGEKETARTGAEPIPLYDLKGMELVEKQKQLEKELSYGEEVEDYLKVWIVVEGVNFLEGLILAAEKNSEVAQPLEEVVNSGVRAWMPVVEVNFSVVAGLTE